MDDLHEEIAKVAYELFERDGKRHGLDKEHWSEAERIVKARQETSELKRKASRQPRRQPAGVKKAAGQKGSQHPRKAGAANADGNAKKIAVKPGNK